MPHLNFLASVIKYEQLSGCSILAARFSTLISRKACSSEIVEMLPRLTSTVEMALATADRETAVAEAAAG